MPVKVFGVAHSSVKAEYFPALADFGASTKPTSTAVGTMIDKEAARLAGALAAMSVSAATVSDDAGVNYPNAYAWCQDTITLGAAIRVMRAIAGEGAVPKAWREALESRYDDLAKTGWVVLADAPQPAQAVNGPRSHISNHSLDTGDEDLISDVAPVFRRSDEL